MPAKQKKSASKDDSDPISNRERIAERLRKAREDTGLSQTKLAKESGIGRSAIVHYENAKAIPGGMELIKLASTLGVTPNFILSGSDEFHASTEPEHAFAIDDMDQLIPRLTLCMLALDRDVRESVSELLMSLVKQKFSKKKYQDFMDAINALSSVMPVITPDMENMFDEMYKEGRFSQMEKDLESLSCNKEK